MSRAAVSQQGFPCVLAQQIRRASSVEVTLAVETREVVCIFGETHLYCTARKLGSCNLECAVTAKSVLQNSTCNGIQAMRQTDSSPTASQAMCQVVPNFCANIVPRAHIHVVIAIKPLYFCTGAEVGVFLHVCHNDWWRQISDEIMHDCATNGANNCKYASR